MALQNPTLGSKLHRSKINYKNVNNKVIKSTDKHLLISVPNHRTILYCGAHHSPTLHIRTLGEKFVQFNMAGSWYFLPYKMVMPPVGRQKTIITVFNSLFIIYKQTLYDYPFFPNSFIFDATLLCYITFLWYNSSSFYSGDNFSLIGHPSHPIQ